MYCSEKYRGGFCFFLPHQMLVKIPFMHINLKHHKNIVKPNILIYNVRQVVWGTNTYYVNYTLHKRFRQTCYNSLAILSNIQNKYVCCLFQVL